jgi:uncharacterized membrane protein YccC
MPGVLPQLRARLDRRAAQAVQDLGGRFIIDLRNGRPFPSSKQFGKRFSELRAAAVKAGAVPASLAEKLFKDTRKTCATRLILSGVDLGRLYTWTGHSPDDASEILREHYLVMVEDGQLDIARQYEAWAERNGLALIA